MSAAVATSTGHAPSYASALRGELRLGTRRVAVWTVIGVWAACIAAFAYLVSYISTIGADWYTPEQQELQLLNMLPEGTAYYVVASLPLYCAPMMVILGAIIGASDYGRGTLRSITARFARRDPLILARLTGVLAVAAITALATLVTSMLASIVVAIVAGREIVFPGLYDLVVATVSIWLIVAVFLLFGLALGVLTRSVIAAIAIGVGWVLGIETLLVGMLAPSLAFFDAIRGFLPIGAGNSLAAALVPDGRDVVPAVVAATGPGVAIVVLIAWACLFASFAFVSFRRRDLV